MSFTAQVIDRQARRAVALHRRYAELLDCDADDGALDACSDEYVATLQSLAGTPALTFAQVRSKVEALQTCIRARDGYPAEVIGDHGLAASIAADVLGLQGVITLGKKPNVSNGGEKAAVSA